MEQLKLSPASKKISTDSFLGKKPKEGKRGGVYVTKKKLVTIQSKVVRIEKILGKENTILKEQLKTQVKQTQNVKRKKTEEKFEKKPNPEKEKKKILSMPRIGFFERVKNFIGKVLLGFIAVKLLPYLPQLLKLLPAIQSVVEFVSDLGIGLIDALGTFLEGAYKLRTKTIEFIENIGGEGAVNAFLKFEKAIEATLTALIAIGGIMAMAGGRGGRGGNLGQGGRRGFDKTGRRVSKSAQRKYFQKYGRDKFIERFGTKNLKNLPKAMQRSAATKVARRATTAVLGKKGAKMGLKFMKRFISPVVKRIPILGGLIDFALNFFVFKEPLGRAAFAAIGSTIFGSLGAVAGSVIPFAGNLVGGILGGLAGDIAGKWLYDAFFSGKQPVETDESGNTTTTGERSSSSGQSTPKATTNMSQVQGAPLGMSQKQAFATVYELAKKHQAKFPEIVAAQAMHETGYLSESLSSVFNSTGRTNAFGQTGDRGHGTIPRAGSATGWTMYPSLDEAVKDNITLWHRVSNHPGNYEAFDKPIDGIASVAPVYSPNADPANIRLGYTVDAYSSAMVKIMKSMGFDPYKANEMKDLSTDAQLQAVTPIMSSDSPERDVTPNASDTTSTPSGNASNLSGEAGRYVQSKLSSPKDYQAITEHPDFGGVKGSHSTNSWHYQGRALDIGAWTYEQGPILKVLAEFNKKKGVKPVELIHGGVSGYGGRSDPKYHGDHVHVAYHAGKRLSGREGIARILKNETVLDADTTKALGPTLLQQLDDASTPAAIQKVMAQAAGISERASYEETGAQTIIVNQTTVNKTAGSSGGGMIPIVMGGAQKDDAYGSMLSAGQ